MLPTLASAVGSLRAAAREASVSGSDVPVRVRVRVRVSVSGSDVPVSGSRTQGWKQRSRMGRGLGLGLGLGKRSWRGEGWSVLGGGSTQGFHPFVLARPRAALGGVRVRVRVSCSTPGCSWRGEGWSAGPVGRRQPATAGSKPTAAFPPSKPPAAFPPSRPPAAFLPCRAAEGDERDGG